jgi:hypothetical protein
VTAGGEFMLGYYYKDIITASNSGATGESLYKNNIV